MHRQHFISAEHYPIFDQCGDQWIIKPCDYLTSEEGFSSCCHIKAGCCFGTSFKLNAYSAIRNPFQSG